MDVILQSLSNGAIITSRFTLKDHMLEAIRYKKFSISDAFLHHSGQVTFTIYSIAVSDEGCVSVCCLGVPYVFLLDMDLRHILDYPSGDILYVPRATLILRLGPIPVAPAQTKMPDVS